MFQAWTTRLSDLVSSRIQSAMRELVLSFAIILLVALSFLWGTIAAYLYLVQELGAVKAAALVAAFYAVLAILLLIIRAAGATPSQIAPASRLMDNPTAGANSPNADRPNAGTDSVVAFLKAVTATSGDQEPQVLDAATEALRTLSPVERLGMLAVMGFLAGRKLGR